MARQVQDGVGRTAQRSDDGDGVFKRLASHDVARLDAPGDEVEHGGPGVAAVLFLILGNGVLRAGIGQAHAQRFNRRGHRVRRVHAAAASRPRDSARFDLAELLVGDRPGGMLAHGLEHADDIEVFPAQAAG